MPARIRSRSGGATGVPPTCVRANTAVVNGLKRQIAAEDGVGGGNQRAGRRHEHLGRKGSGFVSTFRGNAERRQKWRFHLIAPFEGEARRGTAILLPAAFWLDFAATRLTQSSLDQ